MDIHIHKDKQEVAKQFALFFNTLVQNKPLVHVALSGGSTPKVLFDILASEFKDNINWSAIHLYWGDERCVGPEDEQSNYRMTVDHLLSKINIPSENIHRIKGESQPLKEAKRYGHILQKQLPTLDGLPVFDLVILGMGDDGHTASIFPHEINLWNTNENCVVATHPETGQNRVSLTGPVINSARTVAFLVTGENKAEKVDEIIHQKNGYEDYPAALVAPLSGKLVWYLDESAAKNLLI